MRQSYEGRVVLVTGSSRGIGAELASGFAAAGATVVLNARSPEALVETERALAQQIADAGGSGSVGSVAFDVTDEDAVRAAVAEIASTVGAVDVLVNNAGIQRRGPLTEISVADWQAVIQTNLTGAFLVSRHVAPAMIEAGSGAILNICSVQTARARATTAPYAASKAGLAGLTRAMCVEWGPLGLRANGLAPGYLATELNAPLMADPTFSGWVEDRTPARRWGELAELVGPALWLCSDDAAYVNGQIVYADGGMTAAL
ncbi:SDR family oxidoreductase [Pseudactinotalea suaedae]|uniref:SDR family oxidoreductase n=1 Tax=Pseudactinotalea suaedae TaxID=1524924 RepID=UPI0012E2D907|nr:SDR family oxidoreductase [Pseudactinotalea suaedae]